MNKYTPLPLPYSHHIEDYGHFGPVVDGLLIARRIVIQRHVTDADDEISILRDIDRRVQEAQAAYSRQAK